MHCQDDISDVRALCASLAFTWHLRASMRALPPQVLLRISFLQLHRHRQTYGRAAVLQGVGAHAHTRSLICTSGLSLSPRGWTLSGRCGSESLLARSSSLTSRTWHGDKTLSYGPARASSGVLCALRYDYARCGLVERAMATVRRPASVASPQPPPPPPLPVLAGADSAASMAATLPWSHTGSSHVS